MIQTRRLTLSIILAVALAAASTINAQQVVDKTLATVGSGTRTQLITYSDVIWQLALQPNTPLDPPRKRDLDQALETLINQRIFAIEAARLPRTTPSETRIAAEVGRILQYFPSTAAFETRLKQVGFDSVKDDAFQRLIEQRLAIEDYVEFRFGSFVVVTAEEENKFYRETFVPDFRRRSPGIVIPTFEEKRAEIREVLTSEKKGLAIEKFLDEAKRRVTVVNLIEP
ncbi:MAG: hypothetical protein IPO41_13650 [Acidobacteria bacterium]|nr:hypothetical protein [Acidobacteriota bacterium]MBK9529322.1 hypothetical protein [Acidobacteriota bacterium]MBP7475136.1 hypothetical protein [Pyrinomonadaceae bacterium]MBP9110745.1 hypothetical protein [Pyrinomonadaceae bacterium]